MATVCFVGSADDFVKFIKDIQALATTEKAPSINEVESAAKDAATDTLNHFATDDSV